MKRLRLIAAVAALALAGFTDKGKNFSIDFPQGWSAPVEDAQGNAQSNAPDGSFYCRANSVTLASLKDATQSSLNAQYKAPLDLETWAGVLSVDATKVQIAEGDARLVNGRIVQSVTMTLGAEVLGSPKKARFVSYILPGRMVNAGCFAGIESFDGTRAVFEATLKSLKPL
jgi:hypothetical protein